MNVDYKSVVELVLNCKSLILNNDKAHQITVKGLADYVTQVDFSVQSYLTGALAERYPDIQFLGEEGQKHTLDWSRPVWILDPVDGTTNLIHDFQESCVSLGLWDGHELVFGCVYNPFHEELFEAVKGRGTYLNHRRVTVSGRPTLAKSLIMVGTSPYDKGRADQVFDKIKRLYVASEDIRRSGSAAIDLCTLGCGRADGFFEYDLKPWDYAASIVIITEAGGTVTNEKGEPIFPGERSAIVASNGHIHQEMLDLLAK